jgi:hypothetical protein
MKITQMDTLLTIVKRIIEFRFILEIVQFRIAAKIINVILWWGGGRGGKSK